MDANRPCERALGVFFRQEFKLLRQSFSLACIVIIAPVHVQPEVIVLPLLVPFLPLTLILLPMLSLPTIPLLCLPMLIFLRLPPLLIPLLIVVWTSGEFDPSSPERSGKGYGDSECCDNK